jgi:ComF family protein
VAAGSLLVNVLLPPHCITCDSPVAEHGLFCAACFRRTSFLSEPLCRRCGVPFTSTGQGGAASLCPSCAADPPLFGQARAAFRYDDQGRRLILPFKHGDRQEMAGILARHMVRAGGELLARADVLVPMPLHRLRLFKRRYNQAALLAFAVGRAGNRPVVADALVRVRATPPLEKKSAAERAEAVADAFQVRPSRVARVSGRRVLLVDDVMTSGASANACAAALLESGAAGVDVLVAARVPDPTLR